MMHIPDRIRAAADETGLYEYGAISTKDLEYSREVRKICEGNSCRQYGASWACPPAVGTLAECRKRVERYDTLLLFSQKYELADSFDFEGMGAALEDFKKLADRFHRRIWAELGDFLLLSNEGCGRCALRCRQGAIQIVEGRARVDSEKCVFCGYCARSCPQVCIKVV